MTPRFDRVFLILFIASLGLLCFVAGQASMHFRWEPYYLFTEAVTSARAWEKERNKPPEKARPYPRLKIDVTINTRDAFHGYTLLVARKRSEVVLVDMGGNEVHRWTLPIRMLMEHWPSRSKSNTFTFFDAMGLPNGDLLAVVERRDELPSGYALLRLDQNSQPVWVKVSNAHHYLHRSAESGNAIYSLTHSFVKRPPPEAKVRLRIPFMDDYIAVVSDGGDTMKTISLVHAFFGTQFEKLLKLSTSGGWDLMHTNSVVPLDASLAPKFPQFKAGQLLVSFRELNTIAMVDPDTGKIVWAQRGPWRRQHDASFLPNGNILLFDNHGAPEGFSRVVEFNPVKRRIEWQYAGNKQNNLRARLFGKIQRLNNGNTLISNTTQGGVMEVTHDGKLVWQLKLTEPRDTKDAVHDIVSSRRYAPEELPFLTELPAAEKGKPATGSKEESPRRSGDPEQAG